MTLIKRKTETEKLKTVEFKAPQLFAFRFTFLVFIISLPILIFIIGCPQVMPKPVKATKVEPQKDELPKVEPSEVKPMQSEAAKTGLSKAEPLKVEPPKAEPPEAEPRKIETPKVEPNEVGPLERKPYELKPTMAEATKAKPDETESAKGEPDELGGPKSERETAVSFHDKCADILGKYVNGKGMVNYKLLKRKRLDLKQLLNEFDELERKEYNSWPKEDKIAFWINAYNIKMLKIIVDNYPIRASRILSVIWGPYSIRHIDKSIGGIDKQKFIVMDEEFTLAEIEQLFFHKEFDKPRVVFALSRASFSGPPLRNEPYYGHKLDEQLEDQTKKFLSSPRGFRLDRDKQTVYLSAILEPKMYGKAFVDKYGIDRKFKDQQPAVRAVLNFITNYISEQDVSFLETEYYSVKYIIYNWRINDGSTRR